MSYNTRLQSNNADLKDVLDAINDFPESDSSGGILGIEVVGENLHDPSTDKPNIYLSGGAETPYNGWSATDYIALEAEKKYVVYVANVSLNGLYCARYNTDKVFLTTLPTVVNCSDKAYPLFLDGNDGFIRFSAITSQTNAIDIREVSDFDWKW